jgi:hypothetical protein
VVLTVCRNGAGKEERPTMHPPHSPPTYSKIIIIIIIHSFSIALFNDPKTLLFIYFLFNLYFSR